MSSDALTTVKAKPGYPDKYIAIIERVIASFPPT